MKKSLKILLFGKEQNLQAQIPNSVLENNEFLNIFDFECFESSFIDFSPDLVIFSTKIDFGKLTKIINVPYIILDNNSKEETIIEYIRNGAFDYVSKNRLNHLEDIIFEASNSLHKIENDIIEITKTSSTIFVIHDNNNRQNIKFISKNIETITGYKDIDFVSGNIKFESIIHEQDVLKYEYFINKNDKINNLHYRIITIKGILKWVSQSLFYNDNILIGSEITEITELILQKTLHIQLQDNLSEVIESSNFALWTWYFEKDEIFFNPLNSKFISLDCDKIINTSKNIVEKIHAEDKINLFREISKIIKSDNNSFSSEIRMKTVNNNWNWFCIKGKVEKRDSDNRPTYITGFLIDISERKNLEESFQKNEILYYKFFETIPVPFHIIDETGTILNVNSAWEDLFGVSKPDVLNRNISGFIDPEMNPEYTENIKTLILNKSLKNTEYKVITKNNKIKTIFANTILYQPLKGGNNLIFCYLWDMNYFKNTEKKNSDISSKIEDLCYNIESVYYSFDPIKSKFTLMSAGCAKIFGIESEEFIKFPALWTGHIYYEDLNVTLTFDDRKLLKKNTLIKYRIVNNINGSIRWISDKIVPYFDSEGNVIRIDGFVTDINESEILQNELNEKNDLNNKILETSNIGYAIYNLNGNCIDCNNLYAQTLNFSTNEVLSQNVLYDKFWVSKDIHILFKKSIKENILQNSIFSVLNKDIKTVQFFDLELMPFLHKNELHVIQFIRDISEIKKTEQTAIFYAIELKNLIQTVNIPIIDFDLKGNITGWNNSVEKITGWSKNEVIKVLTVNEIFDKSNELNLINYIENISYDKIILSSEMDLKHKDGSKSKIIITGSQRKNIHGILIGGTFFGQDITELDEYRTKLENKIEQRTIMLKAALQKEKDLIDLKSKFVSMASHEFRTPLAAINFSNGYLKKYWNRLPEEERLNSFNKIEQHIKHMTVLLDDILTMGRLENGKVDCKPIKINFRIFFEKIIDSIFKNGIIKHEIDLTNIPENLVLFADEKLAINIFNNLLTNAIKFSPDASKINIIVEETTDGINISIQDYGIGISNDDLGKIFEPFQRGENVDTIQSTGLGLSIVKHSIELHGGFIKVESTLGIGTTFYVSFPKENYMNVGN